ncbi:SDR family oxidoreductase [Nocardioides eburneiflavus]|uniref:SDR family NAD(P)-dependent oxidoreductase n=1 Tax=Nocardioides eburneiflavus TaxID=2518372 RepID=UPI00319E98A2
MVTGAGSGIGKALAERLAIEGVRVVVNDLDATAAAAVAASTGALAVPGDAATEAGVELLHAAAVAHLDTIDAWFANAGVDAGRGLQTAESEWAASWEVNVMAHVRAARLLLPDWVERGSGRFVVTASAAGVLTMLGAPAYAVTKHGAVAFAEWLATTYRHRGVVVQAICPQGVDTPMLRRAGALQDMLSHDQALTPADVADMVWSPLHDDRFLVLPHPEVASYAAARGGDRDRWLAGMNRLQQRLEQQQVLPGE